LLRSC